MKTGTLLTSTGSSGGHPPCKLRVYRHGLSVQQADDTASDPDSLVIIYRCLSVCLSVCLPVRSTAASTSFTDLFSSPAAVTGAVCVCVCVFRQKLFNEMTFDLPRYLASWSTFRLSWIKSKGQSSQSDEKILLKWWATTSGEGFLDGVV